MGIVLNPRLKSVLYQIPDVLLCVTGLMIMLMGYMGHFPIGKTSILCDDPSIRRIFTGDTVPPTLLIVMSTVVPFINVLLLELVFPRSYSGGIKPALRRSWALFKDLFHGQLLALVIVEFLKLSISEPRPYFYQYCMPGIPQEYCDQGYVEVTWRNCTNPFHVNRRKLIETMKSFPSGHATLGAFIGLYMARYVVSRVRVPWSSYLGVCLALCWAGWGALCSVSRMWDNRHHWWDVVIGALIGIAAAHATILYLSRNFLTPAESQQEQDEHTGHRRLHNDNVCEGNELQNTQAII